MEDTEAVLELISGVRREGRIEFAPETANDVQWTEFLTAAKNACARGVNHPTKGAFWRSCQSRLADLSRLAAEPESRLAVAAAARLRFSRQRDEARADLLEALELMRSQGLRIEPSDRDMLIAEYVTSSDGLLYPHDLDDLLARLGMTVGARVSRVTVEMLSPTEMARLRSELEVFETDSLYAFLGLRMDSSCAVVASKIDELKVDWSTKRADHRKSAATCCLTSASKYLTTSDAKRRYEVSWAHQRLSDNRFLSRVRIAARDGVLDSAEVEQLLTSAGGFGIMRPLALDVLRVVGESEGFRIHEPAPAGRATTQPKVTVPQSATVPIPRGVPEARQAGEAGRPVPKPGAGPETASSLTAEKDRIAAAICYIIPVYSLYLVASDSSMEGQRSEDLRFAAYQSLMAAGVGFVVALIVPGIAFVVVIVNVVLAVQAYRGVPMKLPVLGNWALRKAA